MTDNGDATYENDRGYSRGLEAAWDAINRWIKSGPLPEPAHSERNGMVLAANEVRKLINEAAAD